MKAFVTIVEPENVVFNGKAVDWPAGLYRSNLNPSTIVVVIQVATWLPHIAFMLDASGETCDPTHLTDGYTKVEGSVTLNFPL